MSRGCCSRVPGDKDSIETSQSFAGLRNDYRVIAADLPWWFKSNSVGNPGRNALCHYQCMSLAEIMALPVGSIAADDCVRFLWITGPFLAIGAHVPVMDAWGFKPSGMGFVWIKLKPNAASAMFRESDLATGTGFTTRKNAEYCLIGKRGLSVRRDAGVHEVIIAPRREHSRRPDQFYSRVEQYAEGPYLDLFARQTRPGWDAFGNEKTKFDPSSTRAGDCR